MDELMFNPDAYRRGILKKMQIAAAIRKARVVGEIIRSHRRPIVLVDEAGVAVWSATADQINSQRSAGDFNASADDTALFDMQCRLAGVSSASIRRLCLLLDYNRRGM